MTKEVLNFNPFKFKGTFIHIDDKNVAQNKKVKLAALVLDLSSQTSPDDGLASLMHLFAFILVTIKSYPSFHSNNQIIGSK